MNQEMVDMSIGYGLRRARVALGIFGFLGALEFTHFLNAKAHFTPINKG